MESNLKARIRPGQARRKQRTDRTVRAVFFLAALISGSCIVLITLFILMKGIQPFLPGYAYGSVSLKDFLLGTLWRQDQGCLLYTSESAVNFAAVQCSLPVRNNE